MNMSNFIKILIILILILSTILGLKIYNSKNNSNSHFKALSAKEIREKMLSALEYNNFTYYYTEDGETKYKKVKDNIIVAHEPTSGTFCWADTNTLVAIGGNSNENKYIQVPSTSSDSAYFNKDFIDIDSLLPIYGDNLYHIKNEKYSEHECLVIKAGQNMSETFWVDNQTGFILKYESTDGTLITFKFELNNVTNKDVEKPKL